MLVRALLIAAAAALLTPASAAAADTVIGFEDLTDGTEIRNQYATQGVIFGGASDFGFPNGPSCTPARPTSARYTYNAGGAVFQSRGAKLGYCGGGEFPLYASAGAFSSFRSKLNMLVTSSRDGSGSVNLRAYDVRRKLLATGSVPERAGTQSLAVQVALPSIAFFVVEGPGVNTTTVIDELTFDNPPVPPAPQFAIGITESATNVRQGGTRTIQVRILRFNGSTGPITFSVGGLPTDVTSRGFSPNPASGSAFLTTTTLSVGAETYAPTADRVPVTVSATPSATAGSQGDQVGFALDVIPPFRLATVTGARVAPCTPTSHPLSLQVADDFTEPIQLSVASDPSVAGSVPATFTPGFSPPLREIVLTAPPGAGPGDGRVFVTARSGAFSQTVTIPVDRYGGSLDTVKLASRADVFPTTVRAPMLGQPGTYLEVRGAGLCPNATVRFGAGDGVGAPLENRSPDGRVANVRVPPTGVNGALELQGGDGPVRTSKAFVVQSYRRERGFPFRNFTSSGPSWDDVVDLYGKSETNIAVDPCEGLTLGLVNCSLGATFVPSPVALIYWRKVSGYGEKGNCYGVALGSYRLSAGRKALSEFAPAGATTAFDLAGAAGPAPALRAWLRKMMLVQSSREALSVRAANVGRQNARTFRERIETAFAQGRPAILSIRSGDSGHALLAYNVSFAPGGYAVDVYDSNLEYEQRETTDAAFHVAQLRSSRVIVTGSSWSYDGGLNWSGGFDKIGAYDAGGIPDRVSIPDAGGDLLTAILNPDALSMHDLRDASGRPLSGRVLPAETGRGTGPTAVEIPRGRGLRATLKGRGQLALFGAGRAFAVAGSGRALTLDRSTSRIGVEGAASGTALTLTRRAGGGERVVTARFGGAGRRAAVLGLAVSGAMTLRASAATSVMLEFGQTYRRGSGAQVSSLRLGAGETAVLRPVSWTRPRGLRGAVRGRKGHRLALRSRRAGGLAVRSLRLRATKGQRSATIRATVRLRLRGATTGTLVWQAAIGRKVVRRGRTVLTGPALSRAARGRPVTLRLRAPRGSYRVRAAFVLGGAARGFVPVVAARRAEVRARVS